jgi:hypothetical protein
MPPQVNATLTVVNAAGTGETYDGPSAAGAQKWAGAADVYLRERRARPQSAGGGDVRLETAILVDRDTPAIDWLVGDVVTFTRRGAVAAETRKVATVVRPDIADPDIPPDLVTVTLTLDAA